MQAFCPDCSTIFPTRRTGLQFCPSCGAQVFVADAEPEPPPEATPPSDASDGPGPPPPPGFASSAGPGAPPPPGSAALLLGRAPTPWERRGELGLWTGLWRTWKEAMFSPETFWKHLRPDGPAQDALFFGWLVSIASVVVQAPLRAIQLVEQWPAISELSAHLGASGAGPRSSVDWLFSSASVLVMVSILVAGLVAYPLSAIVVASVTHLFSLLFGAAKHGFWATFRIVAYASAPLVFFAIPVVGTLAGLWTLVLMAWGIARVQDTTPGRAGAAVFTLPVALCCCVCGGLGIGLSAILTAFR